MGIRALGWEITLTEDEVNSPSDDELLDFLIENHIWFESYSTSFNEIHVKLTDHDTWEEVKALDKLLLDKFRK